MSLGKTIAERLNEFADSLENRWTVIDDVENGITWCFYGAFVTKVRGVLTMGYSDVIVVSYKNEQKVDYSWTEAFPAESGYIWLRFLKPETLEVI